MDGVETEGRTVAEATDRALEELGLRRDQVEIEILSEGRPRLLGFRGEPARVRVTPLPAPPTVAREAVRAERAIVEEASDLDEEDLEEEYEDEGDEDEDEEFDEDEDYEEGEEEYEDEGEEELPAELRRAPVIPQRTTAPIALDSEDIVVGTQVLQTLLNHMGLEATVTARAPETAGDGIGMIEAVFDVEGDDLGILIGRRGQTLQALQYLLNLMVSKQTNRRVAFGVDVDYYRRRREEALVGLAKRMAARVRGTGRSVTLEPMPPSERRIVHLALAEDPAVMTVSIGEGESRKVAITPTR